MDERSQSSEENATEGGVSLLTIPNQNWLHPQGPASAPLPNKVHFTTTSEEIDNERLDYNTRVLNVELDQLVASEDPYEELKCSDYQASAKTLLLVDHAIREVRKLRQERLVPCPNLDEVGGTGAAELVRLQQISNEATGKLIAAFKELRGMGALLQRLNAGLNGFSSG